MIISNTHPYMPYLPSWAKIASSTLHFKSPTFGLIQFVFVTVVVCCVIWVARCLMRTASHSYRLSWALLTTASALVLVFSQTFSFLIFQMFQIIITATFWWLVFESSVRNLKMQLNSIVSSTMILSLPEYHYAAILNENIPNRYFLVKTVWIKDITIDMVLPQTLSNKKYTSSCSPYEKFHLSETLSFQIAIQFPSFLRCILSISSTITL